jgi:peptide/nickel transport system ATP-binding protein
MYLGRIVEMGAADGVYGNPKHPYTAALLSAVPTGEAGGEMHRARIVLRGDVPSPVDPPPGCAFHPRCPKARLVSGDPDRVPEACRTDVPELVKVAQEQEAACVYPLESPAELRGVEA